MPTNDKAPTRDELIAFADGLQKHNRMTLPILDEIYGRALDEIEVVLENCLERGHENQNQAMQEAWTARDFLLQRKTGIAGTLLMLNPPEEVLT